jgi:hypothetical protein
MLILANQQAPVADIDAIVAVEPEAARLIVSPLVESVEADTQVRLSCGSLATSFAGVMPEKVIPSGLYAYFR